MKRTGRPSFKITRAICSKAQRLAKQGCSKKQIAMRLGIGYSTLMEKQAAYPQFLQALEAGLKEVPWNLELTPVPVSKVMDSHTHSMTLDEVFAKAIDLGFKRTQEDALSQSFRIALPRDDLGVYSIMAVTMNGDINNPLGDRTVHLDQYSGKVLADIGWKDYNAVAKAMAAGVAFHKGDAGWWNLIFSALVCVGILLLAVTGVVLWWKRRSAKTESLLNPPPKQPLSARSGGEKGVVILTLVTGILFPLSGVAMLLFLIVDGFLSNRASRNEQEFDLESS